jgi:AraC-like DNA-binding protein
MGAGMFFKIPMNEIADKNIAFEHIVKIEAREIEDNIQNVSSIEERISIIDDYLVKKLIQNHCDGEQIIHAFNKIYQRKGEISVKKLADTACLSIKQFEHKFSGLVGVNPKQYLRTVRFQHVLQIKKNRRFLDYTSLAMECGYFDQSHFINDFKTITGLTPKNFFKENQPSY